LNESSELSIKEGGSVSFLNNHAGIAGGTMLFTDSDVNFIGNVSFEGNHANYSGGAIYVYDQKSVFSSYGNASFVSNEAEYGGAVFISYGSNASFG
ncbi:unnamed protein product, partial [Ascophyllum nodosum]